MSITTSRPASPHQPVEVAESRSGALLYDRFLWLAERLGMARRRRELLAAASGTVLEIGAGTGLNLGHYPTGLEQLILAEPARLMAQRIDLTRAPADVEARLVHSPAEQLPFEDGAFDTVVATLVLCTVSDPGRAVAEVARVLRPGGQLLFCEHVEAGPGLRRVVQRCSARAWAGFADGCRCDRPTLATIEARMRIETLHRSRWRGMPANVKPLVWGSATA
jgi:ubiquinone/menaquinone biosynthesis C-methylase UbiE